MCARFLSHFVFLYNGRVHGPFSGCTFLREVHPVSAQNKSLISDTAYVMLIWAAPIPGDRWHYSLWP